MDYPFHSDGCSVVFDYDQEECCVRHDWLYWQGGSLEKRRVADLEFYQCVKNTQSRWLASIRWFGVRLGGVHFLPFGKWRWGYGWKWPRYQGPKQDESEFTAESQQAAFQTRLEEARENDRKWRESQKKVSP